jgi:hypothetical protein
MRQRFQVTPTELRDRGMVGVLIRGQHPEWYGLVGRLLEFVRAGQPDAVAIKQETHKQPGWRQVQVTEQRTRRDWLTSSKACSMSSTPTASRLSS